MEGAGLGCSVIFAEYIAPPLFGIEGVNRYMGVYAHAT